MTDSHLKQLALAAIVVLFYADTVSDAVVAVFYYREGHMWWFGLCASFTALPTALVLLWRLSKLAGRVVRWTGGTLATTASTLVAADVALSAVLVWQASDAQGWENDPLDMAPTVSPDAHDPDDALEHVGTLTGVSGLLLSVQDHKFLQALSESGPQCILQGYVLLVLRLTGAANLENSWLMVLYTASLVLSLCSLAATIACVRLAMRDASSPPTLLLVFNVLVGAFCEVSLRILGMAMFVAAFRLYAAVALAVVVVVKAIVVWATLVDTSVCDKIIYLGLSMIMHFHVDRRAARRIMFGIDTCVAVVILVLCVVGAFRPPDADPLEIGTIIQGFCTDPVPPCRGFPVSYVLCYSLLLVGNQLTFWIHELKWLERDANLYILLRACCGCDEASLLRLSSRGLGGSSHKTPITWEEYAQSIASPSHAPHHGSGRRLLGNSNQDVSSGRRSSTGRSGSTSSRKGSTGSRPLQRNNAAEIINMSVAVAQRPDASGASLWFVSNHDRADTPDSRGSADGMEVQSLGDLSAGDEERLDDEEPETAPTTSQRFARAPEPTSFNWRDEHDGDHIPGAIR